MDIDWAAREYGRSGHTDGRIRRRIVDMGRAWLENMGEELPVIFPVTAARTAAYRLLSNPGVSMDHILEPHVAATADRCRGEPVVLAIQDTTPPPCWTGTRQGGRSKKTWLRTLKSSTRIKDRRLNTADDLRKCLAFDAITACHVADLTMRARERQKPRRPKPVPRGTSDSCSPCWPSRATVRSST